MITESVIIAIGIAAAGYFIGNGLKYFNSPQSSESVLGTWDLDDDHQLIKEKDVHYTLGISKEDAKSLIKEFPDIPHVVLNGNIYFPNKQLKEWMKNWDGKKSS